MKTIITSILYFLTGILFLLFKNHSTFILSFFLKGMIMTILMLHYLQNIKIAENKSHVILFAGLIFSLAGDLLLEIPGMFIAGLVAFLTAHVMYIAVFFLAPGKSALTEKRLLLLLPLVLYLVLLMMFLYFDLGPMRFPVMLYSVVILTMLAAAMSRLGKVANDSYWLVVAGATLFVLSDSAIAVNRFGHSFEGSSWFIMTTYISAQYLIVKGYIRQFKTK